MSQVTKCVISSAAFALAITVSTGVCAYQSAPAVASSASVAADNSAVNQRDRSSQTLTPADQPNNHTDIKLAAAVRRALVKDDSLSTSAHNLKLVAARGVVTLRGPVNSVEEKARVEQVVTGVAGVTRVVNKLDVKTSQDKNEGSN
ncbi:MAG: BON domain-containing protein [Rhodanobacter sp.]